MKNNNQTIRKKMDELKRLTLLRAANIDLAKDFEQKIGKLSGNLNNEEDRRRLIFKGLSE